MEENKWELPEGWVWSTIGNVLQVSSGKNLTKKQMDPNGLYPVYGGNGISGQHVESNVPSKTLIIGRVGFYCGSIHLTDRESWVTDNALIVDYNAKLLDNRFLYHLLVHLNLRQYANSSAQPVISGRTIKPVPIPLPPLAEQRRIVARLDALLGEVRAARERLSALPGLKVKGVEVFLRPNEEVFPTNPLKHYIEERSARVGKNWEGVPRIGVSNDQGIIDLSTGGKTSFEKYKIVQPGDFIYNTMRINIGSIAIYEGETPAITSPDYTVFRVKKKLSPKLLLGFLKSEDGIREINNNAKGSVRARLYFNGLVNVQLPIPPESRQEEAEAFFSGLDMALVNKARVEMMLDELERIFLNKAFRGELVPQDPNDEPASVLLVRIAAERAKQTKTPRKPLTTRKRKSPAKKAMDISAILDQHFSGQSFTFEALRAKVGSVDYQALQKQVFDRLAYKEGQPGRLTQSFDPSSETVLLHYPKS